MIQIKPDNTEDGTLSVKQIAYIIKNQAVTAYRTKYVDNEAYFAGNNPTILKKAAPENDKFPNNKIPVPYARKLSLTTSNYLFNKPVNYNADDLEYMKIIKKIFFINDNVGKVNELGLDLIVHGVSYKLFYFPEGEGSTLKYVVIPGNQMMPIYDLQIEPKLLCVIRYYTINDIVDSSQTESKVEVYYNKIFREYTEKGTTFSESMSLTTDSMHLFNQVPCVVYGDKYQIGVFDSVKKIIDGIDTMISMDLNEVEKFALAYLVLTGASIRKEDVDEIIENKLLQLPDADATFQYLTKQINDTFNGNVLAFLVSEVHKQSGVPDFASKDFAAESGIALQYKLMGFENLAASVEFIFKKGEQESIDIINSVTYNTTNKYDFYEKNPDKIITIDMARNIPEDTQSNINQAKGMKEIGVSTETILNHLTMIDDTKTELENIVKEKDENMARFESSLMEETDPGDPDENEEPPQEPVNTK